ncbi:MAG TPA: mycofactocin biosynthesis glycosyltransferase MftF [Streptosporangiaceae bacterium]|nr:mycofactocin biosynthesis glycosyltransferase MftF [Streptosporangiaceae bacterium]
MTPARGPDPGGQAGPLPCRSPVPAGLRLRPDPGLLILAGGSVLVGGSPLRLLRLGARGAALTRGWWDGAPVPGRPAARALARRLLDAGLAHPDPSGGPPGPGPDEVTAVIPVRDRPAELASCLAGLDGMRVIVVDDGSADAAAVAAVAARAGALCLRRDRSAGPGAARNTGLAAVRTPLAAFIDSDCVPRPGWLTPLLPHFADPAAAAVAPRIVAHEQGSGWLAQYEAARSALDMGPAESIVRPGARVPYVPGAALVVRRAAAVAAGGFAEDLPVGEDVDFVWRLAAAGWHIRYEPRAVVGHRHRVRLLGWLRRRRDYGTSAAPLELRHPGTVPACTMSGWSALAWAAAAAGRPEAGAALTGAVTAVLARRLSPLTDGAWPLAGRLAGRGTLAAGRVLGSAVARTWWPVALPAAAAIPRLRLPLAAALLVPPVLDWRQRRPPMRPAPYVAARLLDDLAYSVGVWQGCLAHRTARPLAPALWWWSGAGEPGGPRPGPPGGR